MINANNFTNNNDYSDGAPGDIASPCYVHPADDTSSGRHWTDVKVKERDLNSIFGGIGLPLSKNTARARIEIQPGDQRPPVPAAGGPGQRHHEGAGPLLQRVRTGHRRSPDAGPRAAPGTPTRPASPRRAAARSGASERRRPHGRRHEPSFGLDLPSYDAGVRRLPAGRRRGAARQPRRHRPRHPSCAHAAGRTVRRLLPPALADPRLERRQRRLAAAAHERHLTGGCGGAGGRVLQHASGRRQQLQVRRLGRGQLGHPGRCTRTTSPANFTVSANGVTLPSQSGSRRDVHLRDAGGALTANPARTRHHQLDWEDNDNGHSWNGVAACTATTPVQVQRQQTAHQAFVGTTATAGAVALVRRRGSRFVAGLPGPRSTTIAGRRRRIAATRPCTIFPTVGTRARR